MNDRRNTATIHGRRKHLWTRQSIWSLNRHDQLLAVLHMSMWSFSAVVLLSAVAGRLDLQTALRIIAFGGLVLTRRNVLLSIVDPDLKAEAHRVLLALIRSRTSIRPATRTESDRTARSGAGCPQRNKCDTG